MSVQNSIWALTVSLKVTVTFGCSMTSRKFLSRFTSPTIFTSLFFLPNVTVNTKLTLFLTHQRSKYNHLVFSWEINYHIIPCTAGWLLITTHFILEGLHQEAEMSWYPVHPWSLLQFLFDMQMKSWRWHYCLLHDTMITIINCICLQKGLFCLCKWCLFSQQWVFHMDVCVS